MREIKYNSKQTLRLEYPPDWDATKITSVSLTVADIYGTTLLAETDAAMWFEYKRPYLLTAAAVHDNSIVIAAAGGIQSTETPEQGDSLYVAPMTSGRGEDVCVSYAALNVPTTNYCTLTLNRDLRFAHAAAANVHGTFCKYQLDTTTVATWPLGEQLILTWRPTLVVSTATGTTGTITAYADYSGTVPGTTKATCATHGLTTGNSIKILGTTNYNGTYTITKIDANSFYFTKAYVANDARGLWYLSTALKQTTGYTERAEIVTDSFVDAGFLLRFETLYPREYAAATSPQERLAGFYDEARRQLSTECLLRGLHLDRVIDQTLLVPALMNKVRWLVLLTGDDRYTTEREVCMQEYTRQLELLCKAPVWQDTNQDRVIDDAEYEDHSQFAGLERGL